MQDVKNQETISSLQKNVEDVNVRMTDCESTLSTTRASEAQLKEHTNSLQAKIVTLQNQILPGQQDSAQLGQLKAELSLKVTALQTTESLLDQKASDLRDLTATNGELQSQLNALNLRLKDAPDVESLEAERMRNEEKHRQEVESARSEATAVITKVKALELSDAGNALKKMTADYTKASEKLVAVEKELASSRQQLDELQRKHAAEVASMQKKIDSSENIAANWRKEAESSSTNLKIAQQATEEAKSLKAQLAAEKEAARKAVQEKDSLVEHIRQLRHEYEEDGERLTQELQQCRADSEKLEQRMKAELHAAEERGVEVTNEVQASAQDAISAEKAKNDKQVSTVKGKRRHASELFRGVISLHSSSDHDI